MEIAIFESVIVEDALIELEVEGKKYEGLYVDMNNAPERKYVKEKAAHIAGLKKQVERIRIDSNSNYKKMSGDQAAAINARLDEANAPFQDLINEYNVERKKVLDAEKERKAQIERDIQLEADHELALLMNKTWAYDREQERKEAARVEAERLAEREAYAAEQVRLAGERLAQQQKQAEQRAKDDEAARLANKAHIQSVKTEIYKVLITYGLNDNDAKTVIHLATINELPNLTINY